MAHRPCVFRLVVVVVVVFFLFLLVFSAAALHDVSTDREWQAFQRKFRKAYRTPEETAWRRALFEKSLAAVTRHNAAGRSSYKMAINHMSDWSQHEFNRLLGYRKDLAMAWRAHKKPDIARFDNTKPSALPESVDWRLLGAVTPVKDQGQCGSCWTFATAQATEGAYWKATGHLFELSEQQVASCTSNPLDCGGSGGCEGGIAELGFESIMAKGGLSSEWHYAYDSWDGSDFACNDTKIQPVARITSFKKLQNNSYEDLMAAVANVGPISISVDASAWRHYSSGVFDDCGLDNPVVNHVVLLVGYGVDPETKEAYFLVKNSWTPFFGENGYIRLKRFTTGTQPCGVDTNWPMGSGCSNGPKAVQVCGCNGMLSDSSFPIVAKD